MPDDFRGPPFPPPGYPPESPREPPQPPPSGLGDVTLDVLVSRRGPVTTGLLAVIVAVSLAGFVVPGVLDALAKVNERIRQGELWRLFTPALVHGSLIHLFVNMSALAQIGRVAEGLYGGRGFLVAFVLGTGAATATSFAFMPNPSVGASGGLFAIVGALLAFAVRHRGVLPEAARRQMIRGELFTVGINVVFGFLVPYVDNAAHLGGLAAGFLVGLLLPPGPLAAARLRVLGRARDRTIIVR